MRRLTAVVPVLAGFALLYACGGGDGTSAFSSSSGGGGSSNGGSNWLPVDGGAEEGGPSGTPDDNSPLDTTFGESGSVDLGTRAVAMGTSDGGRIFWLNAEGGQIVIHTVAPDGRSPVPTVPLVRLPECTTEEPTALHVNGDILGTMAIGARCVGADFTGSFIRSVAHDSLFAVTKPGDVMKDGSVVNDVGAGGGVSTIAGKARFFNSPSIPFADGATAIAFAEGYGAAISIDGTVTVQSESHPWTKPVTFLPVAGAENLDLAYVAGGLVVAGFTRGGRLFFQRVKVDGTLDGDTVVFDAQASAVHFTSLLMEGNKAYFGGCIDADLRPWVGSFILANGKATPTADLQNGELFIPSPKGRACVKSLAMGLNVDDGQTFRRQLLALVSPDTGNDRIVRVK